MKRSDLTNVQSKNFDGDNADRQFQFRTEYIEFMSSRNNTQEQKDALTYDILKIILINLQNNFSQGENSTTLPYNLDKYPEPKRAENTQQREDLEDVSEDEDSEIL